MRVLTRSMIATTFLLIWFFVTIFLYAVNLAGGGNQYATPFTNMMTQAGCIPPSYINGTAYQFNTTNCQNLNASQISLDANSGIFNSGINTILALTAAGAIATIFFPNVWGIFAAFTIIFMWWISFPINVINASDIPFPIKFGIYGFYFFAAIALVAWYKGGEPP